MDKHIIVHWEVEDGYVGKSRPQKTKVSFDEFEDDMTDEDIEQVIQDAVQEDFDNKISWYVQREEGSEELGVYLKKIREEGS